jgi:hypothetical protein
VKSDAAAAGASLERIMGARSQVVGFGAPIFVSWISRNLGLGMQFSVAVAGQPPPLIPGGICMA